MALLPIPFNNPYTYPGHSGVDFPQKRGTIFRASAPGYVSSIDYGPRPGHTVWVKYDGGPNVGYCHMDWPTTLVKRFDRVNEGTALGPVGSLGLASTGPHLHVEVAGAASTAGFWRFFDRNRVVGSGSGAGGGSNPFPTPGDDFVLNADDKKYFDDWIAYFDRLIRVPDTAYSWGRAAVSEIQDKKTGMQMKLDGIAARNDSSNTMLAKILSPEFSEQLATDIVAKLPAGGNGTGPTADEIAKATIDLLATRVAS